MFVNSMRTVRFQEKARVRTQILGECKTQEGHDNYMRTAFGPWMLLNGDKVGKASIRNR
jgi:hypothetical protein